MDHIVFKRIRSEKDLKAVLNLTIRDGAHVPVHTHKTQRAVVHSTASDELFPPSSCTALTERRPPLNWPHMAARLLTLFFFAAVVLYDSLVVFLLSSYPHLFYFC